MAEKTAKPSDELMLRLRRAFFAHGYAGLSMTHLARICGFTRRSLYRYFSSKDEVFRAATAYDNRTSIAAAFEAGESIRRSGGSALDIIAKVMDVRYGELRREFYLSPHAVEINAETFRLSYQVMITWVARFHERLTALIGDLEREGLLELRDGQTASKLAELLAAGGRGINQSLPPIPPDKLAAAHRTMCQTLLFGSAAVPAGRHASKARSISGV